MTNKKINKHKIDEVDLSSFIGGAGAAAVKSGLSSLAGKPSLSTQDQLAKDNFIKSFVSKTATELDSAIKSGVVKIGGQKLDPKNPADAKILQKIQQQQGINQPTTAPAAPATAPAAAPAVPQTPAQIRQTKQAAAAKVAQTQMKPAIKPVPVTPQTPAQIRQTKQAAATQAARAQMKPKTVKENTFKKLNSIFESIMSLTEQSISDFVSAKTIKYLGGSAQQYLPQIKQISNEIETAYGKGGFGATRAIKAPLTKLANLAYSVASVDSSAAQSQATSEPTQAQPSQVQPSQAQPATTQAPATQQTQPSVKVGELNKLIPTLKGRDLLSIKKTIDNTLAARQAKRTIAQPPASKIRKIR